MILRSNMTQVTLNGLLAYARKKMVIRQKLFCLFINATTLIGINSIRQTKTLKRHLNKYPRAVSCALTGLMNYFFKAHLFLTMFTELQITSTSHATFYTHYQDHIKSKCLIIVQLMKQHRKNTLGPSKCLFITIKKFSTCSTMAINLYRKSRKFLSLK